MESVEQQAVRPDGPCRTINGNLGSNFAVLLKFDMRIHLHMDSEDCDPQSNTPLSQCCQVVSCYASSPLTMRKLRLMLPFMDVTANSKTPLLSHEKPPVSHAVILLRLRLPQVLNHGKSILLTGKG